MENTATPRQRWALFCITKKDYRNEILSKEEAAKMIQELGNPNYKKAKTIAKSKTISDELLDYLKSHIDELYNACLEEMGYKSVIEDDFPDKNGKKKRYAFVGFGCGITYLTYRKNNKRAEEINKSANKFRNEEILKMLIKKLPKKEYKYLEKIGCPFEAIWHQMQNLQCAYYHLVIDFAKTKGIEMSIKTYLD